jgi:hypothetical protein
MRFNLLELHRRVDFVKSQSFEIIGTVHRQGDRWQQIQEFDGSDFEIFVRERVRAHEV